MPSRKVMLVKKDSIRKVFNPWGENPDWWPDFMLKNHSIVVRSTPGKEVIGFEINGQKVGVSEVLLFDNDYNFSVVNLSDAGEFCGTVKTGCWSGLDMIYDAYVENAEDIITDRLPVDEILKEEPTPHQLKSDKIVCATKNGKIVVLTRDEVVWDYLEFDAAPR